MFFSLFSKHLREAGQHADRRAIALVVLALPLHVVLALGTDLSPDEAYYLCAARLSGRVRGLVDHPPLIVWLLRLSDECPALPVELRVRLWPILFSLVTGFLLIRLARERLADASGRRSAAFVGTWTILPMIGGFVATPDAPLLLALAVLLLWSGQPRMHSSRARLGAAMLASGLGALSKVVMLPLALPMLLFAKHRPVRERILVLACALAPLPLLLPSLFFQLRHAFAAQRPPESSWSALLGLRALAETIAVQVLLWTPWTFIHGLRGFRSLPASDRAACAVLSALLMLSAMVRGAAPEANWWAPAALILVLSAAQQRATQHKIPSKQGQWAFVLGAALPTFIAVLHTLRPCLPLPPNADPTARLHGWSHGVETPSAAGVGAYGVAAERCVYADQCDEIILYFNKLNY